MKHLEKYELSNVLVDVRKAYRLLYLYQKRVMDTVKFMADQLSKNIQGGWALYSSTTPRNGSKMNLDQWAWDWLNMYFYEFNFQDEMINSNKIKFSIAIQSDDGGYFRENDENKRLDIDIYTSVEQSKTKFIFFVGKNRWKPKENIEELDRENYYEFIKNNISSPYILQKQPKENEIFIAKSYLLEDFINEESIREKLNDLKNICHNNGIEEFSFS